MGQWVFEELRGGPRRTPQEAELFKDKDADEGEYAGNDYLVREVIQNALDAHADGSEAPVRVRFALHAESDAPSPDRLAYYFKRLRAPLEEFQVEFGENGVPELKPRFLVCEDFETRGLEGDERLFSGVQPGEASKKEAFYWFWRNIGSSAKTGDDLGRWGLGKTVYRAVSRARCMLGLTVRRSDRRSLLMGQGVLQPHRHGNTDFHPEGYWCADNSHELPLPITIQKELDRFRTEWHLTRNGEPGLSVVSPFVPDELQDKRILQAVIVNFFVRILRDELVVEVTGPEIGTVTVDSGSIDEACKRLRWAGQKRKKLHAPPPLDFVRACCRATIVESPVVLGSTRAPDLQEGAFPDATLAVLQKGLANGDLVAVRLRIALPRRQGANEVGVMDVFLQRSPDGDRCDSYYVREGMTITKRASRAEHHGVRSLVLVEKGPLANLLGDTEGPAHEDWDKSAERPDRVWKTWKNRVEFARKIVDSLVEYLTPQQTEPDFDLLSDFFSIEEPQGRQRHRQVGRGETDSGAFPKVNATPKWYQITARTGGFTVSRDMAKPLPENPCLTVSAAYDLSSGNPLKRWNSLDFDFRHEDKRLTKRLKGATIRLEQGNILTLKINSESFSLSIDGFDRNRDLLVRVDDLSDQEPEPEAG